ncbi:hypothetical protein KIN20_037031 [Parelaphostrongylus tenuis]|uniref:Uncharacterized protein n=1 Tax=Parelaphostrongylus tenuis TaxID=148309 RepID=A0AAD5WLR7_PARTN|nr:hypothetical protein KIN20_037031 [Parelaphostrongylus tenuis]
MKEWTTSWSTGTLQLFDCLRWLGSNPTLIVVFRDDINRICANFDQCTSLLISKGDKLLEDFYGHQSVDKWRTAKQIDCWFCDALSLCNEGDTAADVLLQASLLNDPREYVVK